MEIDIRKRKVGLNFLEDGTAEIWLWAPFATTVSVLITESELSLKMQKESLGYWYLKSNEIAENAEYCFALENKEAEQQTTDSQPLLRSDPASVYQKNGVSGNSTAYNLKSFNWTDLGWQGVRTEDLIIYELHTGTFTPTGDFNSITEKIDYLLELGITAIEIMPVAQFPGNRNWGYDGVYPFAVQDSYGGPEALQQLINTCHEKGLAVILDVVYNHFGPEGNYLKDFGPYFTAKYNTPWGDAINFDDANCDAVREYFIENCLMWFRDFHIDALRLDAVHAIKDLSTTHILAEIKQYVNQLSAHTKREYLLLVELDLNDNKYINPLADKGYGMDAQWIDEFHHALRVTTGEAKNGYYADFNGIEHLAKSYRDAYVYDGQYSPHRQKKFGIKADRNQGNQFIVFSQNHDHVGNRMLGERTSSLVSFDMLKLMAGAVFCSPYIPLIFMGEEYGETNPFQFFISHTDENIVESVRKGRKSEFAAFHHSDETPDPQSEDTFKRSKLNWEALNENHHKTLFAYYKALIALRKSNPVLNKLDRTGVFAEALKDQNCLILTRSNQNGKVYCLMNFSKETQGFPGRHGSNGKVIFNSAAVEWRGSDTEMPPINDTINVSPESILILESANV